MLRELKTEEDKKIFGKYKLELIKLHQTYANKLGLIDQKVENYTYEDTLKHIGEQNYYQYLIINKETPIGILEYEITKSNIDNKEILYIHNFYIDEKERGQGIGSKIINKLKEQNYRIELECWYQMETNNLYKNLGMKEIKTRYML